MLGQELRTLTNDTKKKVSANPFHSLEQELKAVAKKGGRYYHIVSVASIKLNEKRWENRVNRKLREWEKWAKSNNLKIEIEKRFSGCDGDSLYYWSATITW